VQRQAPDGSGLELSQYIVNQSELAAKVLFLWWVSKDTLAER
jgi:hypothetical protein